MPAEVNYAELLGWLEGYEDRAYPREVPESVLAKSREAIRALQAENEKTKADMREMSEAFTKLACTGLDLEGEVHALSAQLAALAPRAEAMEMLEKWLRESNERTAELIWCAPAVVAGQDLGELFVASIAGCDGAEPCGNGSSTDLASAIRAAIENADAND